MLLHSCRSNSPALAARSLVFPSRSPCQEETRDRGEGSAVNRYCAVRTKKRGGETRGEKQKEEEGERGSLRENDEERDRQTVEHGRREKERREEKKR